MKKICFLFFSFLPLIFIGQSKTADSLNALIKSDKNDSVKVHHLVHLACELERLSENWFKISRGVDSVFKEALEKARASRSKMLEHYALSALVSYYLNRMDCVPALTYCREDSLVLSQMRNRAETVQNLCHLAMIYERMPKGLRAAEKSYMMALKMKEEDKDTSGIIFVLGQMEILLSFSGEEAPKAMDCDYKMLQLFKARKDRRREGALYMQVGEHFYFRAGNYKKAIQYFLKSFELTGDSIAPLNLAQSLRFLAGIFEESGNYREAIKYYEKSINADKKGISAISDMPLASIADCYIKLGKYKKAKESLDEFLNNLDADSKTGTGSKMFNQHMYTGAYLILAKLQELEGHDYEALMSYRRAAAASKIVMTEDTKGLEATDTILNRQFVTAYTALGKMFIKLKQKDTAEFYLTPAINEAMLSDEPDYKLETVRAMKQLDSLKGNQNGEYALLYAQLKSKADSIENKKQKEKERINLVLLEKEKEYFPEMSGRRNLPENAKIDFLKLSLFLSLILFLAGMIIFSSRKG